MPGSTRRLLLTRLAALAALAGLSPPATARADPRLAALQGLTRHPASAARVGRAYLATYPQEADLDRLLCELCSGADPTARPAARRRAFRERLRDDFARGRTVRVDGWVLAVSEARLCALHALAGPGIG